MRRFAALAVSLGVFGSPWAAYAQASGFEARVPAEVLAAVAPTLESAAADGLPLGALHDKVLEGLAKGVPPDRIGQVVRDLAREFGTVRATMAQQLPGVALDDGEVVAATMAARQGVSPEVLATVWQSRAGSASLEVPITVLGELVRRGIEVPDAVNVMSHVVRTRVPMSVAAQIPGKLDGARGSGAPPGAALGQALRMLNIPDPPGRGRGRGPGG